MLKPPTLLGRLERVKVRDVWEDEARHFTPWLGLPENISLLGDTIGIELEVVAQEKSVGPFKADILCKDVTDDHFILIENQLERTDHTHLGQLITYAAGLNAVTIVWIAKRFAEEHRAAIDWLNEVTGEDFRFFGLEVELWRIGNSQVAPKFNIIGKPNDWTKQTRVSTGELTETKKLQLEFWTAFHERLKASGSAISGTKPRPQPFNNFSIGRSEFGIHASVNTQAGSLRVFISCKAPRALAHFDLLQAQSSEIESEVGSKLEWTSPSGRAEGRISIYKQDVDPTCREDWPSQHGWIVKQLETLYASFRPRILALEVLDDEPDAAGLVDEQ